MIQTKAELFRNPRPTLRPDKETLRKALYRHLTGRSGKTHCAEGHRHTLNNCWLKDGVVYCGTCEKEEKEQMQRIVAPTQPPATKQESESTPN